MIEAIHYERSTCEHPVSAHEVFKGAAAGGGDVVGACKVDRCSCDGSADEAGKAAASEKAQAAKQAKKDALKAQLAEIEADDAKAAKASSDKSAAAPNPDAKPHDLVVNP